MSNGWVDSQVMEHLLVKEDLEWKAIKNFAELLGKVLDRTKESLGIVKTIDDPSNLLGFSDSPV